MKISVIGAGSWGTTLGNLLANKGHEVRLWVREKELLIDIRGKSENTWYLPGLKLSANLDATDSLEQALSGAEVNLCVVPAQFFGQVLTQCRPYLPKKPVIVCANKGIELNSLRCMSEVVNEALDGLKPVYAILSGPSFAKELSREMPTAVSLGCSDKKVAKKVQEMFATPFFRVYTNSDYRGVELGGAVKNIIAIAAGISDGLGFGTNARAALITRGLAEMARLGKALGAKSETFMGLSGMGDLVLTCTGDLSRNRTVGLKLGQGMKLIDILAEMRMVAEGVKTTEAVHALGKKIGVELPITGEIYKVLHEDKDPRQAVIDLMTRALKDE